MYPSQHTMMCFTQGLVTGSVERRKSSYELTSNQTSNICNVDTDTVIGNLRQKHLFKARSTNSVGTLYYSNSDASMAPLQNVKQAHSVSYINALTKDISNSSNSLKYQQKHQKKEKAEKSTRQQQQQPQAQSSGSIQSDYNSACSSVNESCINFNTLGNSNTKDNRSLSRQSNSSFFNSLVPVESTGSLRSLSPSSRKSTSSGISNNTAKNEQQSGATATAATVAATDIRTEKEKKRKEVSSSRQKKFHRHFTQVSKDEKLINYFSCALVSDILLQGHLYITDQHFAFYSNVFGYVTKVVIPTSSVTKISKEKTAKIIPNAVGVATADERHVFGSFISREAAFRLMCSVCPPLAPVEIVPKMPADIEISEEYSIEDDSSCSISGNESPPQPTTTTTTATNMNASGDASQQETLLRRSAVSSSLNMAKDGKVIANDKTARHSDIPFNARTIQLIPGSWSSSSASASAPVQHGVGVRASAPPSSLYNNNNNSNNNNSNNNNSNNNNTMTTLQSNKNTTPPHHSLINTPTTGAAASAATNLTMIIAAGSASTTTSTSESSSPTPSTSSLPTVTVAGGPLPPQRFNVARTAVDNLKSFVKTTRLRLKCPSEVFIVYLGVFLSLVLAVFSIFLLYRIIDIEAKTNLQHSSPIDFNWRSGTDDDIFAEALRWQKDLQTKSAEEVQSILNTNLEQIAKVRRSLETLSTLIHDRSSVYAIPSEDDSD